MKKKLICKNKEKAKKNKIFHAAVAVAENENQFLTQRFPLVFSCLFFINNISAFGYIKEYKKEKLFENFSL